MSQHKLIINFVIMEPNIVISDAKSRRMAADEILLIEEGYHDKIMKHIEEKSFSKYGEDALIERGNHEEIVAYITRYPLSLRGLASLLMRRCSDEITLYFQKHPLDDETRNSLYQQNLFTQPATFRV